LIGRPLLHLRVVGSTNDVAKWLALHGCCEGTSVLADFQTSGRGRLGRKWEVPAGCGLLLSVVYRPDLPAAELQRLTMLCGLAVVDAVREETGLEVGLKWPNDVVHCGAKLGGILAESALAGDSIAYCVVGLGLNVNLERDRMVPKLARTATSLSQLVGRPVARMSLLWRLLRAMDHRYAALEAGWPPHSEWAARLTTLGSEVAVTSGERRCSGTAVGVEEDGALLVRLMDGRIERVRAEDVLLHGTPGWHQAVRSDTIAETGSPC